MVKLKIANGKQEITKVCNQCGCKMGDLTLEDIAVKRDNGLTPLDSDGNQITRSELPDNLKICKCDECDD